ncbi:MAG: TlpA family protein disulfide reductase [Deltaproteobacteria bacterium]|nr:TlpA family protein disulfide reductase [Deltaproteobacteria bacterium]
MRLVATLILSLLVALPTLAVAEDAPDAAPEEAAKEAPAAPQLAPASDFTLPSMAGDNVSLSDVMGDQVVVLSFWATWCGPCLKEMPKLVEMQNEFGDQVKIFWISVDDAKDEAKIGAITKRFKLPDDQVLKDFERKVVSAYHKRGVPPFTVVIDKNKLKVLEKLGYTDGDEKKIHDKVAASL